MKIITYTGLLVIVIFGILAYFNQSPIKYIKETVEVEKIVEVETLNKRITDAKEQALASTTERAKQAYDKVFNEEMKKVEDSVKEAYIVEIEATITATSY